METHGQLLKKLIRRKKMTNEKAAELLGFSRQKLNRLFNREQIDEITLEEIEKIFQVSPTYFPAPIQPPPIAGASNPTHDTQNCWQLLAEARQEIITLQRQLIEMSKPSVNAPMGKTKGQPV